MKAFNFKLITLILVSLTNFSFAQESFNKKFHEAFDVEKTSLFEISNKFGNIQIENTDQSLITIDAEIIVKTSNQEKADKIMNKIKVTIVKTGNLVSAKTEMDDINSNNTDFEINYHVTMPAWLAINLNNKYGDANIDELHGKSNLSVKYGSLKVNKIIDGNDKPLSTVELGYSDHSNIGEFNWGKVIIKYSKLSIDSGKALVIASKYSKLELGNFSSVVGELGYDELKISEVNNAVLVSKYTDIEIEKLTSKFKIENKYGDIEIEKIPAGFESIDVVSQYADIRLRIAADASYQLNAKASYADIEYENVKISQRVKEDFSYEIIGQVGDNPGNATVKIISDYGNTDIRPN